MKIKIVVDHQFDKLGDEFMKQQDKVFEFEDRNERVIALTISDVEGEFYIEKKDLKWLEILLKNS